MTCAASKKKRSLRTLPCRRTACSPQNLPLRKESSAKRKNCLREAEFPQQTAIPPRIRILPLTVPILMRISVPFAKAAPARTKARPKTCSPQLFPTRIGKTPKRPPSVRQSSRSRRNVRHRRRAECKPPPLPQVFAETFAAFVQTAAVGSGSVYAVNELHFSEQRLLTFRTLCRLRTVGNHICRNGSFTAVPSTAFSDVPLHDRQKNGSKLRSGELSAVWF